MRSALACQRWRHAGAAETVMKVLEPAEQTTVAKVVRAGAGGVEPFDAGVGCRGSARSRPKCSKCDRPFVAQPRLDKGASEQFAGTAQ